MKYKKVVLLVVVVALAGLVGYASIGISGVQSSPLELRVETGKKSYVLGEPVDVSFLLANKGEREISLGCFGVGTGEIQLSISKNGRNFLAYDAGWGTVDAECHNRIRPGETLESRGVKILWNSNPDLGHLNQDAAREVRKGKILYDYAFPNAGTYYLKASAFNGSWKLSSMPTEITVTEPLGESLEVWNKIKSSSEIAYFLQEGDVHIPSTQVEGRAAFQREIEEIIGQYPTSFYTQLLQRSLDKFRASEAKREKTKQERLR